MGQFFSSTIPLSHGPILWGPLLWTHPNVFGRFLTSPDLSCFQILPLAVALKGWKSAFFRPFVKAHVDRMGGTGGGGRCEKIIRNSSLDLRWQHTKISAKFIKKRRSYIFRHLGRFGAILAILGQYSQNRQFWPKMSKIPKMPQNVGKCNFFISLWILLKL